MPDYNPYDMSSDPTLGTGVVSIPAEYLNTPFIGPQPQPQPSLLSPTQPNPLPTPTPTSASGGQPSILSTIMRIESGGRNVPQSIVDINSQKGDPAQGYYQITNGTWGEFGGQKTGFNSAIDAPYATQVAVAQNIPVARWGPATQAALRQAGYQPQPSETLGQMLARYGQDPNATRPEDVGASTAMASASAPTPTWSPPSSSVAPTGGLLAQQNDLNKQTMAAMGKLQQQGMSLLGEGSRSELPTMNFQQGQVHRPQIQAPGNPDFTQMLARLALMQRT